MGYLSLGDSYSRNTDTIMGDCPSTTSNRDFEKIVNDIFTHSDTVEGAFKRICRFLSHCNKNGLVFNAEKFKFARKEVEFARFMITDDGITQTPPETSLPPRNNVLPSRTRCVPVMQKHSSILAVLAENF